MAPGTSPTRSLYWRPPVRRFISGQEAALDTYLEQLDNNSSVWPVQGVEDLLLTPDGVTQSGGYRYTWAGFSQIAQELAAGLSTVIPDIAGCDRRPDVDAPELYDLTTAISLFNAVITLRFDWLRTKKIIRNNKHKLIEGLVGPLHKFLDNRSLYHQANEAIKGAPLPVRFQMALLIGRRLSLWYRTEAAVFTIRTPAPHQFWTGYYFSNGEAAGVSLRAAEALYMRYGCALGSFRDLAVNHRGKNFASRAGLMFDKIMEREPKIAEIHECVERLLHTSLNVVGTRDEREQRQLKLAQLFWRKGVVNQGTARDLVYNALCVGRDVADQNLQAFLDPSAKSFEHRTAYDLYCSLVRRSKELGVSRREKIEQMAYELLLGKLKV